MAKRFERFLMALPSKSSFWKAKTIPRTRLRDARNSIEWFNSKADSEMSDSAKASAVFGGKRQQSKRPQVGHLYLYKYWAKWDKTLPTWDQHPLIALVEYRQGG